jgi:hypothetical protein
LSVPYHAWTHAPKAQGGTDPIRSAYPIGFRAIMGDPTGDPQSIPNFSEETVEFALWENEDSSTFLENTPGGVLTRVSFLAQGVYTISGGVYWDDTSADMYRGVLMLDDSGTSGNWTSVGSPSMGMFASRYDSEQFTYPQTFSVTRKYPLLGVTAGDLLPAGVYGRVTMRVMQLSGIAKDLNAAWLDIFYLGPTMTSI